MTDGGISVQRSFGASVDVARPDVGLYFVCATDATSESARDLNRALARVGAGIAARVSETKSLAVLSYPAFEELRADRAIGLVGPVTLDPGRFRQFQQLTGTTDDDPPRNDP